MHRIALVHGILTSDDTRALGPLAALDATVQDERGETWRELIAPHQLLGKGPQGEHEAKTAARLCAEQLKHYPPNRRRETPTYRPTLETAESNPTEREGNP